MVTEEGRNRDEILLEVINQAKEVRVQVIEKIADKVEKNDLSDEALQQSKTSGSMALVGKAGKAFSCIERRIINMESKKSVKFQYRDPVTEKIYESKHDIRNDEIRKRVIKEIDTISPNEAYFQECDVENCPNQHPNGGNPNCPIKKDYERLRKTEDKLTDIIIKAMEQLSAGEQDIEVTVT